MVKIVCDKSTKKLCFSVFGVLVISIVLMILMAIFSYTFDLVASIITLLVVLTCIILFVSGYYKSLKKSKNVIIVENGLVKYNYKKNILIPLCQIQKVESDNINDSLSRLLSINIMVRKLQYLLVNQ